MGKFDPKMLRDASDIGSRFKDLESRVRSLETSGGLDSASFSGRLRVARGGTFEVDDGGDIHMRGGGKLIGDDGGKIELYHTGNEVAAFVAGSFTEGSYANGMGVYSRARKPILFAQQAGDHIYVKAGDIEQPLNNFYVESGRVDINTYHPSNGWIFLNPASQQVAVNIASGGTSTSPVVIDGAGRLWRGSSSLRYKTNISDSRIDPDHVLGLTPRSWHYRDTGDAGAPPARSHGFIAEEVEATGLRQAVVYDEDGQPDALDYNAIVAGLVKLAKRQQDEINELKAAVSALMEERPDVLESS